MTIKPWWSFGFRSTDCCCSDKYSKCISKVNVWIVEAVGNLRLDHTDRRQRVECLRFMASALIMEECEDVAVMSTIVGHSQENSRTP